RIPRITALRVVLAHRPPGALAQIGAPLIPRVRIEEVVLGAAGRLGEARVLGGLGDWHGSALRGMQWCEIEEVRAPRFERGVEAVAEVVTAPLVDRVAERIGEPPERPAEVVPRQRDVAFCARLAEVHDDQLARIVVAPAPRDEVLPAVVAIPAAALAELPGARAEDVVAQAAQEPLVERPQVRVGLLVGP